jgi:hypothetical protein
VEESAPHFFFALPLSMRAQMNRLHFFLACTLSYFLPWSQQKYYILFLYFFPHQANIFPPSSATTTGSLYLSSLSPEQSLAPCYLFIYLFIYLFLSR